MIGLHSFVTLQGMVMDRGIHVPYLFQVVGFFYFYFKKKRSLFSCVFLGQLRPP